MSIPSPEHIRGIVLANRAIRAPFYDSDQGLAWGDDIIPALMGLFRIEKDPREDRTEGWMGFGALPEGYKPQYARNFSGDALRIDFHLTADPTAPDAILVVTAMTGRVADGKTRKIATEIATEISTGISTAITTAISAPEVGELALPGALPSHEEWIARAKEYQKSRSADDSDGAASLRAFVAAIPGWKGEVAQRLDAVIDREVLHVQRAIKWHQPFYSVEGQGYIVSFTPLAKKVKLTFMSGTSLDPIPPGGKKDDSRWIDLQSLDDFDEEQVASWVRQAAVIPGWFP